jgi:pyruvate dehydrogenase E1 component
MLHPGEKQRLSYVQQCFESRRAGTVFVAATDYVKAIPCSIVKWLPGRLMALGTDGFGRSDGRAALRDYFEVDSRFIALSALCALAEQGKIDQAIPKKAIKDFGIDPEKAGPMFV